MKLKTGIIGCGKVGDFHAKAYAQLENSEFTAVCDADLERAKAFAERYNVHAYSDIAEMIQKEHLDVVSVCTPHPIHCDPAVTAAENGCNVLIEKPLASSLADCDRIIEARRQNHVTIGTMVQRPLLPPCMRIHEAIEAGKIGQAGCWAWSPCWAGVISLLRQRRMARHLEGRRRRRSGQPGPPSARPAAVVHGRRR